MSDVPDAAGSTLPIGTDREFDVVLFGASGFVGALTAAHLAGNAPPHARIALAGRSAKKVRRVVTELADRLGGAARDRILAFPVLEVDAADPAGVADMVTRAAVVATTVGPYAVYGKQVARACAEAGTHYCDLTGEVLFVRWSMDELNEIAHRSGARIVHACGFDSIPSDLGVMLTAHAAAAEGQGELADTVLRVKSLKGGFSGGTIDSARQQAIAMRADPQLRKVAADPYTLSPERAAEPRPARRSKPGGIVARLMSSLGAEQDPDSGRWDGPFVMSSFNTRIVRLSNALTNWSYGRSFRYREVTDFGRSALSPVMAAGMGIGLGGVLVGLSFPATRAVLDRVLPKPGEGPDEATRAAGRFRMDITATTTTGARYVTTVAAPYDPGYDGTAVMLGEAALCLARDDAILPERSGVLTPATAMGSVLVERLVAHGFTFDTSRTSA